MMNRDPEFMAKDIRDQACRWFVALQSEAVKEADRLAFEDWQAASLRHREAYDDVVLAMDAFDEVRNDADVVALRQSALHSPLRNRRRYIAAGLAAGIALVVTASAFLSVPEIQDWRTPFESQAVSIEEASRGTLETAIGEQSTVTLADGSVIDLNTDTRMRTYFTADRRQIVLTRGQAIFDVTSDPDRPFVVIAGDQRITAVGTQFEVRTEPRVTAVTLLEGRVLIDEIRIDAASAVAEAVSPPFELAPGDRFIAMDSAAPVIERADLVRATSWREGRVDFEDESLLDVIHEINRYSTQKIDLHDPGLMELKVSGSFRTGSVDNFLTALTSIYPVTVDRRDNRTVLQWKDEI